MTEWTNLLSALFDAGARFLIVSGYAAIAHGHARATEDLDIWIEPTLDNATRVRDALTVYGAAVSDLSTEALLDPYVSVRVGTATGRKIDMMPCAEALDFSRAWRDRFETEFAGLTVPFLGLRDLLVNKRAVGRHKDLADIESLEAFHRLSRQHNGDDPSDR